ncbi:hypothetical protein JK628_18200 [Shewanella sp. KX20019]|uniref:hypothetical protein n=1 Tax=Shewanella sp. KX20019 TaxID=2803864 RepID=UPI0019255618|nr:hypothetical protein [Shewanella sp. KX20019]QQX79440.1 hypothetical protein JK628_18200 [Shewanella sp. KX20019]
MKKILSYVLIIPMLLIWSNSLLANEIEYGVIENNIYKNSYFNIALPVPELWAVQSKAAINEIREIGGNLIAGDDQNLQAIIKESEKQTVNMFAFFKFEQGSPVEFNPSIMAVAERVAHMPGIKRGSDYFFHVKKILRGAQIQYTFSKEIYSEDLSGVAFDVMPSEISIANMTVNQEYYATRYEDYVLSFILTYKTESEQQELRDILSQLSFSN